MDVTDISQRKDDLRKKLRAARLEHAAGLPPQVSALVFRRPPAPVLQMIPQGAAIGLYSALEGEAPASGYARFFAEAGHTIALPRVSAPRAGMTFHAHTDPFGESDLERDARGMSQPAIDTRQIVPDVLFVPLVGFSAEGARLGQGGGHYDRWLADRPETLAIGLAWDIQEVDDLPMEAHDMPLTAVVTPTRILGPF